MNSLSRSLLRVAHDLGQLRLPFAVVGGLAVAIRTEPRFTRDVDLAVAVEGDDDVEGLVFRLRAMGYETFAIIEHRTTGRIATVRVGHASDDSVTDLMFASTGIEAEIVAAADLLDVAPPSRLPVATTGHLIAMKRPRESGGL